MNFKWKREFNKGKQDSRSQIKNGISKEIVWAVTVGFWFDPKDPFDLGAAFACQLASNPATKKPWKRNRK